ncbi:MAG TPA: helix-turn-helix domain-containing protein [Actinocrinis sp.]|nr:helix-turn-helix domain-containing protein [Actinocrinis sp.]
MSATPCPAAADPIAAHIQEFAAGHGVYGHELDALWTGLRERGLDSPGLAFAAWAETSVVLGGLLTPILTNCPDLATVLADLERFHPLFDRDRLVVTTLGSSTSVTLQTQAGGPAATDTVDACFALLCRLVARLTATLARPVIVVLRRAQPQGRADREAYRGIYGSVPVAFGQPADRCVFAVDTLSTPVPAADPVVRSLLRPYAERQTSRRGDRQARPWSTAVSELMAAGQTRLPDVARTLMVSTRTLQLRLNAEEQTFAALLDAAQHDTALSLLARPDLPITSIAGTAGFATPSAFARAVRRWTGMTPSQYRTSVLSGKGAGREREA